MKKKYALVAVVALISMAVVLVLMPGKAISQTKNDPAKGIALPDSINKIVQNSCFTCHSTGGNGMAASHVNFTKWETYDAAKQASKAASMFKMVNGGKMPPKKFKESHPDAVLTPAQVVTIGNWANSLKKK